MRRGVIVPMPAMHPGAASSTADFRYAPLCCLRHLNAGNRVAEAPPIRELVPVDPQPGGRSDSGAPKEE
jgi:hypothetical protein